MPHRVVGYEPPAAAPSLLRTHWPFSLPFRSQDLGIWTVPEGFGAVLTLSLWLHH